MSTSFHPGSGDHDAPSPWERRILAEIEQDLARSDPRLFRRFARLGRTRRRRPHRWWPFSALATGLLVAELSGLAVIGTLLPSSWWPVLGVITALVVVPWLIVAAAGNNGGDPTGLRPRSPA